MSANSDASRSVTGCYTLVTPADSGVLARARAFRLEAEAKSAQQPELHRAISLVDSAAERMSYWRADSLSDSVRVSIGDGFTGVREILSPSATGLRGRALGFSDGGPREWALGDVSYERRPCP